MAADFGLEEFDAYMILTHCDYVRLGNMADPTYRDGGIDSGILLVVVRDVPGNA
jgi:amidase